MRTRPPSVNTTRVTAALRRTCDSDITSFSKHAAYSARVDCYVAVRVTVQSDVTGEPPAARGKRLESMTSRETLPVVENYSSQRRHGSER